MNKEELLRSIKPGMGLTWDFFKRVYGFEISFPGFAEKALQRLEKAGCAHAREYYQTWAESYENEWNAMLGRVAGWYSKQRWSRNDKRQREVLRRWKKIFQTADSVTLRRSLEKLKRAGVDLREFLTMVQQVQ